MKLASFQTTAVPRWGAVEGEYVVDLVAATGFSDLRSAIAAGVIECIDGIPADAPHIAQTAVHWLPPIPNPGKILCVGHNYESHRQETGRAKTQHPSIFVRFPDTQVGQGEPILRPTQSTMLDYEGELAVIMGRVCKDATEADALDFVAGYSIYNDASVRDWQWHTTQFTPGKNFPGTGGFGPWMVTKEEIPDLSALRVTTRLNGRVMQDQPTSEMIFSVPAIIAYISAFTQLTPGDVIVTGTPGGVGAKRDPAVWMQPGDSVEVEIPGIGILRNPIQAA